MKILKTLFYSLAIFSIINIESKASNNENFSINIKNDTIMKFELPKLPYELNALEPVISKETMELHYGKHYQGYLTNLNNMLPGTKLEGKDLETIVVESDGAIFNNAGQALNHYIYFLTFSPKGGGEPKGELAKAIKEQFGSFENFKKEFSDAAVTLFGSGWVWLSKDKDGKLHITKEPNGGNPVKSGLTPLLGLDVWEHAYYVDYRNRRGDHINEVWKIIDWPAVEARY